MPTLNTFLLQCFLSLQQHLQQRLEIAVSAPNMNALGSLFDFAALMSTSSAKTVPQYSKTETLVSALDTQPSKVHSNPISSGQIRQSQDKMQQSSQQQSGGINSLSQFENEIITCSRTHANSGAQHPIDWILPRHSYNRSLSRSKASSYSTNRALGSARPLSPTTVALTAVTARITLIAVTVFCH